MDTASRYNIRERRQRILGGFFIQKTLKIRPRKGESGQVAILFALVFTFMFVLFAFVVDFGHLINNKINLQIAADKAAYAGAAWQSRLLNRVGMVNYRLRQDLKEFAMRVNVTHLRHNRNFPNGGNFINGGHQQHRTEPFICQQAHGYRALSGVLYDPDTNLCKNASPSVGGLPPIIVPPVIAQFDPFAVAIAAQIRRIQQAANQECRAAANDNRILAQHLVNLYSQRTAFKARQIRDLETYINEVARERDGASARHEVVQAAYQSALRNLTLSNSAGNFQMEVLQPEGGQYLQLTQQNLQGTVFFIDFRVEGNGCVGRPNFIDFNNVVGNFYKQEDILTYFAVKLTATPRLFFMPSRWVEAAFPRLEAFAAAKPFGSRIGPGPTTDSLLPVPNRPGNTSRIVNMSLRPGDRLGMLDTKVMAYLDALHPFRGNRPDGNRRTGWPEPQRTAPGRGALQAIRAPTLFDATYYTVFPDPGPNINTDYPDTAQFAQALYPDYLEASNHTTDALISQRQPATRPYFSGRDGFRGGAIRVNAGAVTSGPYQGYGEETPSSHSTTSIFGLPLMNSQAQANDFGWASPQQIHSGWAPRDRPGRIGYSVKLVNMDALVRSIRVNGPTGAQGPISNPPQGDPNVNRVVH